MSYLSTFVQTNSLNYIIYISLSYVVLCCIITALLVYIYKLKQEKRSLHNRYEQLEQKINSYEVESYRYKLNPHLFKNALNAIQSHAYQTYFALDKLSSVLDYILYESDKKFVTVKDETEFALNLIEINRIKISPLFDLRVKNKINHLNPFYEQLLITPFITTDLIENAFKHADVQNTDSFISIVFELDSDHFILTVSNKISLKPKLQKEKSGIGKQSLRARLDNTYKHFYNLEQFTEGDVYISQLKINLLEYKAKVHTT